MKLMKKLFSVIAGLAVTLTAANMNAAIKPLGGIELPVEKIKATSVVETATPIMNAISVDKVDGSTLAEAGVTLKYIGNHFGGQWYQTNCTNQTPISYDPYTNTLFLFSNVRSGSDAEGNPLEGGQIRKYGNLAYSQDMGETWNEFNVYDYTEVSDYQVAITTERFYSSVAVVNPKKSTNFEDIKIAYRSWLRKNDNIGFQPEYKLSIFGFLSGADILNEKKAIEVEVEGPWETPGPRFSTGIISNAATFDDKGYVYFSGRAWGAENTTYMTQHSMVGIDMTDDLGDDAATLVSEKGFGRCLTEINQYIGGMQPGTDSTYLARTGMDVDSEGNIYLFTLDPDKTAFETGETNDVKYHRYPRIFKSTPDGRNFKFVDSISTEVITDYLTNIFANLEGWNDLQPVFDMTNHFVVTGVDQYSLVAVLRYWVKDEEGRDRLVKQLTEFEKKDGKWNIRKIDIMDPGGAGYVDEAGERGIAAPLELYIREHEGVQRLFAQTNGTNQLQNFEVQVAKTKDGKHLVAKYINVFETPLNPETNMMAVLPDSLYLYWQWNGYNDNGEPISEIRKVKIKEFPYAQTYLSYRKIDGGEWSKPVKAINSDTISTRYTMIPRVVANINEIPIAFCITLKRPNATDPFNNFHKSLPSVLANNVLNNYNYGMYMFADATKKSTAYNGGISIDETKVDNLTFALGEAYPNPANTKINFEFSLVSPSHANLTIYNALGQAVAEVVNQYLDANHYVVDFETANLPVGTYYYVLKAGERSETKMFNIGR